MPYVHVPVMVEEVLQYLACKPGQVIVDGTLGGAGHAKVILDRIMPDGLLIGIDQDKDAIENAKETLTSYGSNLHLFRGNFTQVSIYFQDPIVPWACPDLPFRSRRGDTGGERRARIIQGRSLPLRRMRVVYRSVQPEGK